MLSPEWRVSGKLNESANFLIWCRVAGGVKNGSFGKKKETPGEVFSFFVSLNDFINRKQLALWWQEFGIFIRARNLTQCVRVCVCVHVRVRQLTCHSVLPYGNGVVKITLCNLKRTTHIISHLHWHKNVVCIPNHYVRILWDLWCFFWTGLMTGKHYTLKSACVGLCVHLYQIYIWPEEIEAPLGKSSVLW